MTRITCRRSGPSQASAKKRPRDGGDGPLTSFDDDTEFFEVSLGQNGDWLGCV